MLLLPALVCIVQIGCYQRVVREGRYSSESSEVYEPNVSDEPSWIEQTEDFMWGESDSDKKKKKSRR
jgi:hypothetical protein